MPESRQSHPKESGGTTPKELGWTVLSGVLLVCLFVTLAMNEMLRRRTEEARTTGEASERKLGSYREVVLAEKKISFAHVGQVIAWDQPLEALENAGSKGMVAGRASLILALSQLSCDACVVEELKFANEIAKGAGPGAVTGIVHSPERRYAAALARLNQISFPFLYDETDAFGRANGIAARPLVLVVNDRLEVLAAHYPLPGRPELSLAFHDACRRLLGVSQPVDSAQSR